MLKRFAFLFFFLSFSISFAQQLTFEKLSDKDGLVNSNVTSILKDDRGFMWFGTFNGLSRYDGYTFTNYTTQAKDSTSISGNQIRCLFESSNKTLYVGFQYNGFCIYNNEKDNFIPFVHSDSNPRSLGHDYVLSFFEDSKAQIWVGTRKGLDLFDPKTQQFKHFYPFEGNEMPFVTSIVEDKEGNLWLYGVGAYVCKFNPEYNTYKYFQFKSKDLSDKTFNRGGSLIIDKNDNLWISNESEGIFVYDFKTWSCIKQLNVKNDMLKSNTVLCLKSLSDGKVWIGTDGAGISVYDSMNDTITFIEHDDLNPNSLSGNAIYTIQEFSDNIVWIGTYAAGVNKWVRSKNKFKGFNAKGVVNKHLSQKSILAITQTQDGKIWLGTDGGGLNLFDSKNEVITPFTTQNSSICFDVVKSAVANYEGNLWLGSYQKGLCLWNPNSKRAISSYKPSYVESEKSISGDKIWSLLCSSDKQHLFVGLLSKGLDILVLKDNKFIHQTLDEAAFKNLATANIFALTEDSKGNVWIITETFGAVYYDTKTKNYIRFTTENSKNNSLPSNEIRDVFEDRKGQIWFATVYGGLCKLINFESKHFKSYSKDNGLNTTNVLCILEDNNGNLWISTDKGISKFDPITETFTNFGIDDGLISKEFNYNSKLKSYDGQLYFGGIDGFNYFHPDSIKLNTYLPKVAITKLKLLNKLILPSSKIDNRTILSKTIDLSKQIELNYSDNIITLEFAALEYYSTFKNQYAYFLEGFDTEWHHTGADMRLATYTNLNPGFYTFKVKATNSDGLWGEVKTLQIIIHPPWYMTWWFRIGIVFLILALILIYYYQKIKTIKAQNEYLEEEVKKRTIVIEQQQTVKDKFYSIVAHDLRNPVSALTILSEMLSSEIKETANKSQSDLMENIIQSAHRLKKLVVDLLDWTRSHSTEIELEITKVSVYELIFENIELQKSQASLKNIRLLSKINKGLMLNVDRKMIDTVLRNLLNNAIKFTPNGGEILLATFSKDETYITIMIQDNGVGMKEETLSKLFTNISNISSSGTNNEKGTGLGFTIAKEFIELNNGTLEIKSKLGHGTTFYIHLPGFTEYESELISIPEFVQDSEYTVENYIQPLKEFLGNNVLLVEDDEILAKGLINFLSNYFNLHYATNVSDALKLIKNTNPDLILSDIHMPGEDGFWFCKKLKTNRETSHIPLILMTAANDSTTHQESLDSGADAYIQKPFEKKLLIKTIYNLMQTLENAKIKFSYNVGTLPSDITQNEDDRKLIEKAITFIRSQLDNNQLDGDLLAEKLNCSKSLLYLKLKTLAGMTVNEFIKSIRLKEAAQMLVDGKMNIAQIAYAVGFSEPSYFTKMFHKYYGMTPKEYIKKNNQI
jgi:signal transduction histidine kinase/ligand-binding sensor domain-containing protein/DNA-binding response OmpR family regulator